MDRETWRVIVHEVTRVGYNLASKPPQPEQAPSTEILKADKKRDPRGGTYH